MSLNKAITAKSIKYFRQARELTQSELCGTHLTLKTLQLMEKGESSPRLDNLIYLSQRLQVPINDLIFFDEYLLYRDFSRLKIDVFTFFNTKDRKKLHELEILIQQLLTKTISFEVEQELKIYALYLQYSFARLDNCTLTDDFHTTLAQLLTTYTIAPEFTLTDMIVVMLFFNFITDPLAHAFYKHLRTSEHIQKNGRLLYHSNIFWIQHAQWQDIIQSTELFLTKIDMSTTLITTAFLKLQLAIGYYHAHDIMKAEHHFQTATQLFSLYNDEKMMTQFKSLVTQYLPSFGNR